MKGTLTKKVTAKAAPSKTTITATSVAKKKNGHSAVAVNGKSTATPALAKIKVKTVLIAQPQPEGDKSPYFDLARKHRLDLTFRNLIRLEGISATEFRKYKINVPDFHGIVFTSRNAIDQFFVLAKELRAVISQETKYYCMTEAIALYLQKYILYRKRKVFFGDGTIKGLVDATRKHVSAGERVLIPCADTHKNDLPEAMNKYKLDFKEAVIFRTVPEILTQKELAAFDMIVLFSPVGVQSLTNIPNFKQGNLKIGAFGPLSTKAVEDAGLRLDVKAPVDGITSMSAAIDLFLCKNNK